jgi:hypothetical protein
VVKALTEDDEVTDGPPVMPPRGLSVQETDSDSERFYDSEYEEEEYEEEEEGEEVNNHHNTPFLRDTYFRKVENECWHANEGQIGDVYRFFLDYSPLRPEELARHATFNEYDLRGLEYLLCGPGRKRYQFLPFPRLTLQGQAVALPLVCEEGTPPTTFIVSRLQDYIYSRLVEQALLHRTDYAHLPLGMKEARHSYWRCKAALFPLCREGDCRAADPLTMAGGEGRRGCLRQWLIYTRRDSRFFLYCQRVMDQNAFVDYDHHASTSSYLPVSFLVVNLLCGSFLPEGDQVEKYDEWVAVKIGFLDLWNARQIPELKPEDLYI